MPSRRVPFGNWKPEAGATINWGSSFTEQLACLLLYNEKGGYPRDLVTGALFNQAIQALGPIAPIWGVSAGGVSITGSTGRGGWLPLPSYRAATSVTAFLIVDDTLNLSTGLLPVIGAWDGQAVDYSNWMLNLDDGALVFNGFVIRSGPTSTNGSIPNVRSTVGAGLHVWAFAGANSGANIDWDVWADGVFLTSTSAVGSQLGSTNVNIYPQWQAQNSAPKIVATGFWHRHLTPTELRSVTASPAALYNSLLVPYSSRRMMPAAAVSANILGQACL